MFKKKINYTDFDGNSRSETFYFNFTKGELLEMQIGTNGGYDNYLKRLVESQDQAEITKIFKEIILKAYGIKSDDGKRFIKTDALREEFTQTEAYSELFTELATNTESAIEFINGIMPPALMAEVNKEDMKKQMQEAGLPPIN